MQPSIESLTREKLRELESTWLPLRPGMDGNVVAVLRRTARNGKALRLTHFAIPLPWRSVYDHVVSLGRLGDSYLGITGVRVNRGLLADCIVLHDLNEVLLGDIPRYTGPRIARNWYRTEPEKHRLEEQANRAIFEALPVTIRPRFERVLAELSCRDSLLTRLFKMVDQTDPILAIWRYLHRFRGDVDVDDFLQAMEDFFTNPTVRSLCFDPKIRRLIDRLQDRDAARAFAADPVTLRSVSDAAGIAPEVLTGLICREMHCVAVNQLAAAPPR